MIRELAVIRLEAKTLRHANVEGSSITYPSTLVAESSR
jgi:hypothetical protein